MSAHGTSATFTRPGAMSEVHSEADITHRRSGGFIHAIIICPIAILHTHPFHGGKWVGGGYTRAPCEKALSHWLGVVLVFFICGTLI